MPLSYAVITSCNQFRLGYAICKRCFTWFDSENKINRGVGGPLTLTNWWGSKPYPPVNVPDKYMAECRGGREYQQMTNSIFA